MLYPDLNSGDNRMGKNSRGKRPCSICRKWFQPDVRQKGRQKTCSPDCKKDLHRRQCEEWNKKNQEYFKNTYLAKKIEKAEAEQLKQTQLIVSQKKLISKCQKKPIFPYEIIANEYGIRNLIIIQYFVSQVINHTNGKTTGFT
jgi:hypothetical protein